MKEFFKNFDGWWIVFFIWWIANGFEFLFETKDNLTKVKIEQKQEKKAEKAVDKNEIKADW